jgi:hypothetical protein
MIALLFAWPVGMVAGGLSYATGIRRRRRALRIAGAALMLVPPAALLVVATFWGIGSH